MWAPERRGDRFSFQGASNAIGNAVDYFFGRNSLIVYILATLAYDWASDSAGLFVPSTPAIVATLRPLLISLIVVAIFWLVCLWLYRRRIFVKV